MLLPLWALPLPSGRYLTTRIHLPAKTGSEGASIGAQVVQYRMSVVSQSGLFRLLLGSPVPSLEKCIFFFYVIPWNRIFLFLSKWEESKGRAYKEESSISNQESSPAGIKNMNRGEVHYLGFTTATGFRSSPVAKSGF